MKRRHTTINHILINFLGTTSSSYFPMSCKRHPRLLSDWAVSGPFTFSLMARDPGLKSLSAECHHIQNIYLCHCSNITDNGLKLSIFLAKDARFPAVFFTDPQKFIPLHEPDDSVLQGDKKKEAVCVVCGSVNNLKLCDHNSIQCGIK